MCNFVSGEVLAFGKTTLLRESHWELGEAKVEFIPLINYKEQHFEWGIDKRFGDYEFARVHRISSGHEIRMISRVSAMLSKWVASGEVIVDLNQQLPLASADAVLDDNELRLSSFARRWVDTLNQYWRAQQYGGQPVALIDSGINRRRLNTSRAVSAYDYSNRSGIALPAEYDHDRRGHGTQVARLLDELLPPNVPIVSGKIADEDHEVSVLALSRVFGDIVARERPSVVNLSLAPLDDTVTCPKCRKAVGVHAFQSQILARLFRLADPTITVMAIGNSGQRSNFARFTDLGSPLILAAALGSDGAMTHYTNVPPGGLMTPEIVAAFGGDDPERDGGAGVFEDRASFGTSFAAPFISALVHRIEPQLGSNGKVPPVDFDERLNNLRDHVRRAMRELDGPLRWRMDRRFW